MSTFGTMRSRIRDELDRGTDYDSVINRSIASAVVFYRGRRFAFSTARATTMLLPDIEYYALPTDFIEVDHLRVDEDDERIPCDEVTYDWIEDHFRSTDYRSRPCKYAIQNRELRVWPVPDMSYSVTMSYHRDWPELSASASDDVAVAFTGEGEELIRTHAKVDILENYIQGEDAFAKAARLRGREQEMYREMKRLANRQQSSGRIMPWC